MAVAKTIIKNESQRAVVHLVSVAGGGEQATIALTDLVNTDNGETTSGTLKVNISYMWAVSDSNASSIVVTRGSSTVIVGSGAFEYPAGQQLPSLAISNAASSIVVTFNGKGTASLDLRKIEGYVQPNRNIGV